MHWFIFVLSAQLAVAPLSATGEFSRDQRLALKMLAGVAFRGDAVGIAQVRDRFAQAAADESSTAAARRFYLVALADWLSSEGSAGSSRALEAARRAATSIDQALALEPTFVHAYVLRNRISYLLFSQGAIEPKEGIRWMRETYSTAKKLAPDDPLVVMTEGVMRYYTPPGDHEGGRSLLLKSIDALAVQAKNDPHAAIWLPIAWNWYGTTFLGEGEMEKARQAFQSALKVRPDYSYVRTALLPMTESVDPGPAPPAGIEDWRPFLADKEGDQRIPGLPDLRSVAWRLDPDGDRVWFRLALGDAPDPTGLGVNLALDMDADQTTGNGWWAGNKAFKYDRLVTVWVAKGCDGLYRGSLGVAEASDVSAGRYVTSSPGTVRFAIDPSSRSIVVGVARKVLGDLDRLRMVVTVGSNTDWSDTAPEEGFASLTKQ